MTHHYRQRGGQRGVPRGVLRALAASDTVFLGHAGVRFRIIRHHETFWIAPQRDGYLLTVYARDRTSIDAWACGYLANPDQTRHRLHSLPGHLTPDEALTQELTARWLEV